MKIIVPATTANLGSGFDSFGLALDMFLEVTVCGPADEWFIEHQIPGLPHNATNLIIQTVCDVAPGTPPHRLKMMSQIPTARGLGSSSAAIVAGIEIANQLNQWQLSNQDKLTLAATIEGHPDNVAPAIYGGFTVSGSVTEGYFATTHHFIEVDLIAVIPPYKLLTKASRQVLPVDLSFKQAVAASSIANGLLTAFLTNNIELMTKLLECDRWHEPYRLLLVPELEKIRLAKVELGIYGAVLSGAGPTILVFAPKNQSHQVIQPLQSLLPDSQIKLCHVYQDGVNVQ